MRHPAARAAQEAATLHTSLAWACYSPSACLGGVASACLPGHTGPLCAACDEGYYPAAHGTCRSCGAMAEASLAVKAAAALGAVALAGQLVESISVHPV